MKKPNQMLLFCSNVIGLYIVYLFIHFFMNLSLQDTWLKLHVPEYLKLYKHLESIPKCIVAYLQLQLYYLYSQYQPLKHNGSLYPFSPTAEIRLSE